MDNLTYRHLKRTLDALPEERLDDQISVYDPSEDECHEVLSMYRNSKDHPHTGDVLDEDHLVIFLRK